MGVKPPSAPGPDAALPQSRAGRADPEASHQFAWIRSPPVSVRCRQRLRGRGSNQRGPVAPGTVRGRDPLLPIPGLLCDGLLWEPQIAGLADTRVPNHTRHDSVAAIAESILAEVPARRFAPAGFSLGGFVAIETLRQAAETITASRTWRG
jgi:pimeloyl-ACP methyl ester carboxylesterase